METSTRFKPLDLAALFPNVPCLPIVAVRPEDAAIAQAHLDNLTKPRGSLGRLEELARRLCAMRARTRLASDPLVVAPAVMLTVAGDHGVAMQNVSPFPQVVTRQMVQNFLDGGAAVNCLCRASGMDLRVVDAGCTGGPFSPHEMLLERRLGDGTADLSKGPAMSRETCLKGLALGMELAAEYARQGYQCFGTGEMGIANSTSGAALYCALLGLTPKEAVGPGAGANQDMVRHKAEIVRRALNANESSLCSGDVVDVLAALGGFEIVILSGIMLGAAAQGLPVLVDGFICSAAYAAAVTISPTLAGYAVFSHTSAEPGHATALHRLTRSGESDAAADPLLNLGMRLGEGTGAAVAYTLLRSAAAVYNDMATFESASVSGKSC